MFYRQPGVKFPRLPPGFPIPGLEQIAAEDLRQGEHTGADYIPSMPRFMGETFPFLCKLWLIMHDVAKIYYSDSAVKLEQHALLRFAEYKFRELLVLGDSLPASFSREHRNAHHTVIFQ